MGRATSALLVGLLSAIQDRPATNTPSPPSAESAQAPPADRGRPAPAQDAPKPREPAVEPSRAPAPDPNLTEAYKTQIETQARLFQAMLETQRYTTDNLIKNQAEASQKHLEMGYHTLAAQKQSEEKTLQLLKDSEGQALSMMDKIQTTIVSLLNFFQLFIALLGLLATAGGAFVVARLNKLFDKVKTINDQIDGAKQEHKKLFESQDKDKEEFLRLKQEIGSLKEESHNLKEWQATVKDEQNEIEAQATIMLLRGTIASDKHDEREIRRLAGDLCKSPSPHALEYWITTLKSATTHPLLRGFALDGLRINARNATRNPGHYATVGDIVINDPDPLRTKAIETLVQLARKGHEKKRPEVIRFIQSLKARTEDPDLRGRIEAAVRDASSNGATSPDPDDSQIQPGR